MKERQRVWAILRTGLEELNSYISPAPCQSRERFFFPDVLVKVYSILVLKTECHCVRKQPHRRQFPLMSKRERFMPAFQLLWPFRQFAHLGTRQLMA
jgi:hypothetical protein